ncbi:MAG: sulfurtransferase complex subunit TusB [Gammaproteobacteria bacterium HGW-Gammaproteobacteria-6]|nr:MAG: sulfurtransferase complex subunit TusB [Gammaproteobacteria bacterium HGW-Gammaproteobacteria-6]
MLHILRHSPASDPRFASCLRVLGGNQNLLLIEDAVYALLPQSQALNNLKILPSSVSLYVLQADLLARGMALDDLPRRIRPIDYEQMVELCGQCHKVVSW